MFLWRWHNECLEVFPAKAPQAITSRAPICICWWKLHGPWLCFVWFLFVSFGCLCFGCISLVLFVWFVCLFVSLFPCSFIFFCLSVVCLYLLSTICLSVCLSLCLFVCLVCLLVCLFVCLTVNKCCTIAAVVVVWYSYCCFWLSICVLIPVGLSLFFCLLIAICLSMTIICLCVCFCCCCRCSLLVVVFLMFP